MTRRTGTTLVEVLVAIFIMGIGMIALLTLFPIGVLRMAQAINDERASQAAYNAHENSIIYNIRNDSLVVTDATGLYNKGQPISDLFLNPYPFTSTGVAGLPGADPFGESYTIFVDPIGYGVLSQDWVGNISGVLRRRPTSFANAANAASTLNMYRAFTLWDDMTYFTDPTLGLPGTPEVAVAGTTTILRNSRFSWVYTLRRPMTAEKSVVECSIVVFDSRSLSLTANLTLDEFVYNQTAYFNPNNNTVVVDYTSNTPPPIRPGNWIMDATQYTTTNAAGATVGSQHNYWYRVLATQDFIDPVTNHTYAIFEIQGQIRGFNNFPTTGTDPTTAQSAFPGTVVILDGVAEVFEKGPVRAP